MGHKAEEEEKSLAGWLASQVPMGGLVWSNSLQLSTTPVWASDGRGGGIDPLGFQTHTWALPRRGVGRVVGFPSRGRTGPLSPVSSKLYEASLWTRGTTRLTQWRNGNGDLFLLPRAQGWVAGLGWRKALPPMHGRCRVRRHRMARRAAGGAESPVSRGKSLVGLICLITCRGVKLCIFSSKRASLFFFLLFSCFGFFSRIGEIEGFAGDGIRDTSKNKTPVFSKKRVFCVCMRGERERDTDVPHSLPGKYPRLPIRGALERYGSSKLHMRPALGCTQREGQGTSQHGRSG